LKKPDPKRALKSALTIGISYIIGGLIPLAPYMLISNAGSALLFSVVFTLLALLVFGYVKGRFTGGHPIRSALQTALIGGLAAAAAFGLAKLISNKQASMSQFDEFLDLFPQMCRIPWHTVWNALGSNEQNRFLGLISAIPTDAGLIKGLIKLSTSQVRQTFGHKHAVRHPGTANVGKSTLYNQLVRSKQDRRGGSPAGHHQGNPPGDAAFLPWWIRPAPMRSAAWASMSMP